MDKIITIGREFGSGGAEIAKKLAEKLNIPCYDKDIIGKTAVETGLVESDVESREEFLSPARKIASHFTLYNLYSNMTKDDKIYFAQEKIIKNLADEGPCVIVGRCADYILRDRDDVVNVFIYSDFDKRVERIKALGVDIIAEDAQAMAKAAGSEKAANVALIGLASHVLGFDRDVLRAAVEACVPAKAKEVNLRAFDTAQEKIG